MAEAEVLVELDTPIKRERGYMYYIAGNVKGDKLITHIARKPMKWFEKELAKK